MTDLRDPRTDTVDTLRRDPATWILLATDGTAAAVDATTVVRDTFHDAEVVVMAVVDGRSVADASAAEAILDQTCERLGRDAQRIIRDGRASTAIRDVAESLCIDVVAIGAPGRHLRLRPSTGEILLRRLDCEVLVVPHR